MLCEHWQNEYKPHTMVLNIWKVFHKYWLLLNFYNKKHTFYTLGGLLVCAGHKLIEGSVLRDRQWNRDEQNKNDGPGTEGHWVESP